MEYETRSRFGSVAVFLFALSGTIVIVVGSIFLAGWWLESRFGAGVAIAGLGGVFGVAIFIAGVWVAAQNSRHTLAAAAEFITCTTRAQAAQAGVFRELARGGREEAADVRRLADRRAGLLVDAVAEKARAKAAAAQAPAGWWDLDNESAATPDGGFKWQE